jgi:predicted Zn-dependent protease
VSNVVSNSISAIGGVVGESIGSAMVAGFSQDQELRADYHSLRYIAAAGYDPNGSIALLEALDRANAVAVARKQVITSGLINARPGLVERRKNLESRIASMPRAPDVAAQAAVSASGTAVAPPPK